MSFISEEELRGSRGLNLAPMIDFLFLMLVFFASLAISRVAMRDTDIELVKSQSQEQDIARATFDKGVEYKLINLNVTNNNEYKWVTDIRDYKMDSAQDIRDELVRQYERGLLPEDLGNTKVLVKIDKKASWEPILQLIFAVRDAGFDVYPVYEPEEMNDYLGGKAEGSNTR